MCKTIIQRLTFCMALLMGAAMVGEGRVEAAEPRTQVKVQPVGLFHRTGWHWFAEPSDAPPVCDYLEPGDIPLTPWDRTPRPCCLGNCFSKCCLCDRLHACHEEKKAWHYYIRGVGPAYHERSPGRPCIW